MKRRITFPLIAAIIAPIALSTSPAFASGDDESDDHTETTSPDSDDSDESDDSDDHAAPTTPGVSIPRVTVPSSAPSDSKRAEIIQKLNGALTRVQSAPIDETTKAAIVVRIQDVISRLSNGGAIVKDELERLASDIDKAVRAGAPAKPSAPAGSVSVPRLPDSGDDADDDSDDDSNDDSNDDSSDDSDDDSDDDVSDDSGFGSIGREFRFEPGKVTRDGEHRRGDLAENIARALTAVNALPQSAERDAAIEALLALQTRVTAGENVPAAEAIAVFRQVAAISHDRIDDDVDSESITPERRGLTEAQRIQRMLGVVNEALGQLDGKSGADVDAAVAALQAVKTTLESGERPAEGAFEAAIELARTALGDSAAIRAAMTLSGVIAAVQASEMPADVKTHLVSVLTAARTEVLTNPDADVEAVVRAALGEVKAARLAGVVQHMLAIATRLEELANEVGNADALVLLAEARAILQPADDSTPTRADLHEARHILVAVVRLLRPVVQPTPTTTVPATTTPVTSAPSTTTA